MLNKNEIISLIRYIRDNQIYCSYFIPNINEKYEGIGDNQCKEILKKYETIDTFIEEVKKDYPQYSYMFEIKEDELPVLLRDNGYMIGKYANREKASSFFGREAEIIKLKIIFAKKVKNNVLLIGEPGVGKTRLIEEYARNEKINNIFAIECAKLIGNCEYRGSFEQKVVDLLDFSKKYKLILFLDEIHSLINLGKSTGGMAITDILKPYLLNPEYQFIGATTPKEANYFVEDEAFKRRFSIIRLQEPSFETLKGIKTNFEKAVIGREVFDDKYINYVLYILCERLPNLFFPDKLIDFLDYLYACRNVLKVDKNIEEALEEYISDQC